MSADQQNFSIYAGDYKKLVVEMDSTDDLADIDDIRWGCADSQTDQSNLLIQKTFMGNEISVDGADVVIELEPEDTADLAPGDPVSVVSYYHELQLIEDGKPETVTTGWMKVLPTIHE